MLYNPVFPVRLPIAMRTPEMEYKKRIRVGFIGCGQHAYLNILPSFRFAPIDLVATCDIIQERAKAVAKIFGAERHYTNYHEMLRKEKLDAVFVVTDFDEKGRPRYPKIAIDVMKAGCHVWIEKPPASRVAEVEDMMDVSKKTGKFVLVGFKHIFFPSIQKIKEIMNKQEFGQPASIYVRYRLTLPPEPRDNIDKMKDFLNLICHPGSILVYLMGKIKDICIIDERINGGSFTVMHFCNGAIGTLHLSAGDSRNCPETRVEVIGNGANIVMDNGVKLAYYRPGGNRVGGRLASTYIGSDEEAPIYWEPSFDRGTTENKGLFLLGYAQQAPYFANCVLTNTPPAISGLDDALEQTKLFEAYQKPSGKWIRIN